MQNDMLRDCQTRSIHLDHTIQQLKASLQSESAPSHKHAFYQLVAADAIHSLMLHMTSVSGPIAVASPKRKQDDLRPSCLLQSQFPLVVGNELRMLSFEMEAHMNVKSSWCQCVTILVQQLLPHGCGNLLCREATWPDVTDHILETAPRLHLSLVHHSAELVWGCLYFGLAQIILHVDCKS